jgi:hypothetical protein
MEAPNGQAQPTPPRAVARRKAQRSRLVTLIAAVVVAGAAVGLLMRSRPGGTAETSFTQVGRAGPVFTVSVPRARVADEAFLMAIAEQLSAQDVKAGASGQISVMVWPDDVSVPKQPPTTELDASMKTQIAGIFINPTLNVKHVIRFKDGQTVSERDFGRAVP